MDTLNFKVKHSIIDYIDSEAPWLASAHTEDGIARHYAVGQTPVQALTNLIDYINVVVTTKGWSQNGTTL